MPESKFKVGDEVILCEPSYGREPATTSLVKVRKVAVKYVYLESTRWGVSDIPFEKDTGHQKSDAYGNDNYNSQIWIPAEWESKEHREQVQEALREHGVRFERFNYGTRGENKFATETLEKLLAVLDEAKGNQ